MLQCRADIVLQLTLVDIHVISRASRSGTVERIEKNSEENKGGLFVKVKLDAYLCVVTLKQLTSMLKSRHWI